MLCGIGLRFNLLGGYVFGRVSDKGSSEDREQPVGFQTAEALGRFHHACRRPAERPGGISPSLHIATDATHRPHHVLDFPTPQLCRELQAIDSQHLVETLEDAGGNAGRLLVEPAGEIAQQPLGLVGVVEPQAWNSARRTEACKGLGSRSITLRALWSWHRWIGVWGPNVRRMTLPSALAPSMMNSRQTVGGIGSPAGVHKT